MKFRHWLADVICSTIGCCSIWAHWFEWPSGVCDSRLMEWLDDYEKEDEAIDPEDQWWLDE